MLNKRFTKLVLTFLLFAIVGTRLEAQTYEWGFPLGNATHGCYSVKTITDAQGNVYIGGNLYGTVDFDPGPGTVNLTGPGIGGASFIAKYSSAGNYVWANLYGTGGTSSFYIMDFDAQGNIWVNGAFNGNNIDFDPGPGTSYLTSGMDNDGYLMKIDANGNLLWVGQLGGSGTVGFTDIDFDSGGNIYFVGLISGFNDLDPTNGAYTLTTCCSQTDEVVVSYTSSGAIRWAHTYGSPFTEFVGGMIVDDQDSLWVVTTFETTVNFDPLGIAPSLVSAGSYDAAIAKYGSDGYLGRLVQIGNTGFDAGYGIVQTLGGQILLGGYFSNTVDFDPGVGVNNVTESGGGDAFLLNINRNMGFNWVKTFTGPGYPQFLDLYLDSFGRIYSCGNLYGTTDMDPGAGVANLVSSGNQDAFVLRLDSNANYLWTGKIGNTVSDNGNSIALKGAQAFYFVGDFQETNDLDMNAGIANYNSPSNSDIFLTKYSLCTATASSISPDVCDSYTSPSGLNIWNVSGTYQDILTNATGCDSVITINLTIRNSTTNVFSAYACNSYVFFGNTLTASGIYNHTLTNVVGCDSVITLNLTINASNTGTINPSSCGPATINGTTYNTSGTYNQLLTNAAGCDSSLTINLTVNQVSSGTTTQTSCGPATINGTTYNASGTYNQLLTNVAGCDSSLTINLTVNQLSSSSLTQSACGSFTLNGTTYNSSGTFTQTLINAVGCDSTLTLFLTITNVNTNVTLNVNTLTATASGATYQWLDCDNAFAIIPGQTLQSFTATQSGNYAVIVTQTSCTDTSACTNVTIAGVGLSLTDAGISLFPNPTSGNVTLLFSHPTSNVTARIFSLNGAMIMEKHWNEMKAESFFMDGVSGVYLAEISCDGKQTVWMKVVKN